LFVILKIVYK